MRRPVVAALAALLAGLAILSVLSAIRNPVQWSPDGLYYEARMLELRGVDKQTALHDVFTGPISAKLRAKDPAHTGNGKWVAYNEPFYERRLSVPLAGAALYPVAGTRSLLYVSIAGYVAAILALFALLLVRFRPWIAVAVTAGAILLPPLRANSSLPLTDSWGLALEILALLAAVLTFERGRRWLVLWIAALALLSITRDSTWIPILAAGACALWTRSRTAWTLFVTGLAAAVPALLLLSTPTRDLLALLVNHSNVPSDTSWGYVLGHYPRALEELVRANIGYLRRGQWYTALYLVGGIAALVAFLRAHGGRYERLLLAAAAAALLYVLAAPMFSAFRLELVFVPLAAFGLGLAAEAAAAREWVFGGRPMRAPARAEMLDRRPGQP